MKARFQVISMMLLLALSSLAGPSLATTLEPTQLRGLASVSLFVAVDGDLSDAARGRLAKMIELQIRQQLKKSRLAEAPGSRGRLSARIRVAAADKIEGPKVLASLVSLRLREPVHLSRDVAIEVPDGGALTWWEDSLLSTTPEELEALVRETVDYQLSQFLSGWELENRPPD